MKHTELAKFRALLEQRRLDLMRIGRSREDIATGSTPDMLDQIQAATERDLAVHNLELESLYLREADAALARIDEGAYGVCRVCDEDIGLKRLAAIPWAATCLKCQAAAERQKQNPTSVIAATAATAA